MAVVPQPCPFKDLDACRQACQVGPWQAVFVALKALKLTVVLCLCAGLNRLSVQHPDSGTTAKCKAQSVVHTGMWAY